MLLLTFHLHLVFIPTSGSVFPFILFIFFQFWLGIITYILIKQPHFERERDRERHFFLADKEGAMRLMPSNSNSIGLVVPKICFLFLELNVFLTTKKRRLYNVHF
jgi:hypothetical protein